MDQFNLDALSETAGGRRRKPEVKETHAARQKSREETVPMTFNNQPEDVRRQLRMLALENGDTAENLFAEAMNDLFAKYGRPEIARRKSRKRDAA